MRTTLDIIEAIQQLSFLTIRLPQAVQVRIGIHTGLVVIGELGSSEKHEMLALGETPNLAGTLPSPSTDDILLFPMQIANWRGT